MTAHVGIAAIGAIIGVPLLIAVGMTGAISAMFGSGTSRPSASALADIPADYLALYREATVVCPGLDWSILAAIGKIETDHGRSTLPGVSSGENGSGAAGPMQFLAGTFAGVVDRHPLPTGGASPPSRYDKHDAIHAAAYYLCDNNGGHDLRAAIFAYNHADWYVDEVLTQAALYRGTPTGGGTASQAALAFAQSQLGKPYVWGGDGDAEGGFDCSGLTHAAYQAAGVAIPRTAQTQHDATGRVTEQQLLPGDLVFYGTPSNIHHVGLYLGNGQMIDAATQGVPVSYHPIRYPGDDFASGGRITK